MWWSVFPPRPLLTMWPRAGLGLLVHPCCFQSMSPLSLSPEALQCDSQVITSDKTTCESLFVGSFTSLLQSDLLTLKIFNSCANCQNHSCLSYWWLSNSQIRSFLCPRFSVPWPIGKLLRLCYELLNLSTTSSVKSSRIFLNTLTLESPSPVILIPLHCLSSSSCPLSSSHPTWIYLPLLKPFYLRHILLCFPLTLLKNTWQNPSPGKIQLPTAYIWIPEIDWRKI